MSKLYTEPKSIYTNNCIQYIEVMKMKTEKPKRNGLAYDKEGNVVLSRTNVKGTITQDVNTKNLTLRLFLTKEQKQDLLLEKGEFNSMKVIIV